MIDEDEIAAIVEEVKDTAVYLVEDDGVWFSGMNARVRHLTETVATELQNEGYAVDVPYRDAAGLKLPVTPEDEVVTGVPV